MSIKSGFGRVDITPPLGITLSGYPFTRYATDILDPLYVTAVAFDDGNHLAIVMSVDLIGIEQPLMNRIRSEIAEAVGTEKEGVFIACTHTHLAPEMRPGDDGVTYENAEYIEFFIKRATDAARLAKLDLAPTEMSIVRGNVKDVAFVRTYHMKDGSIKCNPGFLNPNALEPVSEPDETSSLIILKREGKREIGIVNFQVHPDVIYGDKVSADYPKFVRDTYEALVPNSLCMYINGTQGDTNHIDIRLGPDEIRDGYARSEYMGRKIAMSVVANYPLAKKISSDGVRFGQSNIIAKQNKAKADSEELQAAFRTYEKYLEYLKRGAGDWVSYSELDVKCEMNMQTALRIVRSVKWPEERELYLTAVAVGDVVFAGFPGEPFTEIGTTVKEKSDFALTVTACCANGYEGYYPMIARAGKSSYESDTTKFVMGTAEQMIEKALALIADLRKKS